jgi:hypothetical protein
MVRRAEIAQPKMGFAPNPLRCGLRKTGFAKTRLARNQHDAAAACLGIAPVAHQQIQFLAAADEGRGGSA